MPSFKLFIPIVCWCAALSTLADAQGRGGGAWTTAGGDAQRTGVVRTDPRLSKDTASKIQLLWKRQLDPKTAQAALSQPVLMPNIISYKGFKALAFLGGGDVVYSIDYDLNRMFWERRLNSTPAKAGGAACPAGFTAVTRPTPSGAAAPGGGRFGGAAPPAAPPVVGAPGAPGAPPAGGGAPAGIPPGAGAGAPPGTPPTAAAPGAAQAPGGRGGAGGGGGGGGRGGNNNVYAVSSAGMIHALNPQTGEDVNPPAKFLGGSARLAGTVFIDNVLYAAATGNCAGVANGVYAIDLADNANTVTSWDSKGAAVAGSIGPAFAPDGTVFVATGPSSGDSSFANAVVALEARTLKPLDWFTASAPFTASPVVFTSGGKTLIAAANADGSVYVLQAGSLGGSDHKTPLAKSPAIAKTTESAGGGMATWEDVEGTRWIAATSGTVAAFRLAKDGNGVSVAWTAGDRNLVTPGPPMVLNGVLFTVANGASPRASGRSVLYALDATTGKELWNSGSAITSAVPGVPPSGGDGQVYVVTTDRTLYAFGIPMER